MKRSDALRATHHLDHSDWRDEKRMSSVRKGGRSSDKTAQKIFIPEKDLTGDNFASEPRSFLRAERDPKIPNKYTISFAPCGGCYAGT